MQCTASGRPAFVLLVIVGLSSQAPVPAGDDKPAPARNDGVEPDIAPLSEEDLADQRMVFMKSALGQYTIQVGDRKEPARVSDPCLRWSNPVSRTKDGILAVFTFDGGRPAAIAQFQHAGPKNWVNEFAIIASDNVQIMRSERPFWKPSEFICKFADVPGSPVPAAKPTLRLAQMRKIAADFSVIDHFGWEESQIANHNLRLLPQPDYLRDTVQ